MMIRALAKTLVVTAGLTFCLITSATAQSGGHFNIIGRANLAPGGHGEIRCDGGGQDASQLELSIADGPLNVTRVLIHYADPKLKPWASAISPRTAAEWTSRPILWPSGKTHKVTSVEYWYTGKTGKSPRIDLLGLQH